MKNQQVPSDPSINLQGPQVLFGYLLTLTLLWICTSQSHQWPCALGLDHRMFIKKVNVTSCHFLVCLFPFPLCFLFPVLFCTLSVLVCGSNFSGVHFLSWWLCSPVPHVFHLWPITPAFPVPLYIPLCSPLCLSVRTGFYSPPVPR